ncbi:MAG: hypothetical protein ACLFPF_07440, partial [Halanaerobiales bacterium]
NNSDIRLEKKPTISMQTSLGFLTLIMVLTGTSPYFIEKLTKIDLNINYFDIELILRGIQPFLWSIPVFILFKKYLTKKYYIPVKYDVYRKIAKAFVKMGSELSSYHDGKLNRYLLWAATTLILLLILLLD